MGGEKGIKGKQPKTGWGGYPRRGAEPCVSPQALGEAAGESVDPGEVTAGQGFPSLLPQAEGVPPSSLWGLPAQDSSQGAWGHGASAVGATGTSLHTWIHVSGGSRHTGPSGRQVRGSSAWPSRSSSLWASAHVLTSASGCPIGCWVCRPDGAL